MVPRSFTTERRPASEAIDWTSGTVTASVEITEPPSGVVLYDTAPTALLTIYRNKLPARYAKALQRYRFGPGVAKVDFVLSGEIPWTDPRLANGLVRSPFVLYGSRSSLRDLLIERRERLGLSYISVPGNAMREFGPIVAELRGT